MDNSTKNTQNIVSMSDYQPHSGYAPISLVEAYWDALRDGREMPKRADIDPRGIESALEYAFILERVAPGVARLRIAGSHLHDLMGMEARGMPLTSFFEQENRTRVANLLEEVFQTPATAEFRLVSTASLGQPALEARMILLPLKSDLGDVSRILGCFVAVGDIGTIPRRFDLSSVDMTRLGNGPEPVATAPQSAVEGFAEPQSSFEAETPKDKFGGPNLSSNKPKWPAYLRLVQSDE